MQVVTCFVTGVKCTASLNARPRSQHPMRRAPSCALVTAGLLLSRAPALAGLPPLHDYAGRSRATAAAQPRGWCGIGAGHPRICPAGVACPPPPPLAQHPGVRPCPGAGAAWGSHDTRCGLSLRLAPHGAQHAAPCTPAAAVGGRASAADCAAEPWGCCGSQRRG